MQAQVAQRPGIIRRFFSGLGRGLTSIRRWTLNLLTLLFLVMLVVLVIKSFSATETVLVQDKSALVLNLNGALVEESSTPDSSLLSLAGGSEVQGQVQMRDLMAVLKAAASDAKITRILLKLDDFEGGGLASLRAAGAALEEFKKSGKPVIAWAPNYSQAQYFLAAHANEVLLDPAGMLELDGLGGDSNYYAEALSRVGVKVHVVRTGAYKNMAEQFTDNAPSPATLESSAYLLDDLWGLLTTEIEQARGLPQGKIMQLINALPEPLIAAGGDMAKMALDQGLVTGLKDIQQVRQDFIKVGEEDAEHNTFRQIGFDDYLASLSKPDTSGEGVGIIVAEGEIIDGEAPRQTIGGESTAALVRQARLDDEVKAIVLRVNSPGGAVFGSELIRRELALAREAGKPVVVSMGDVAASGGYWISTASDRIFADAGTITGSIGVVTMVPTFEGLLEKASINSGGYATTWLKSASDLRKPLDPRLEKLLEANIQHTYQSFLGHVGEARKMKTEDVDKVAQGRVWTGKQALDRGLVDELGGLEDAVKTAKQLAKLEDSASVRYIESEESKYDWLFAKLMGAKAAASLQAYLPAWLSFSAKQPELQALQTDVQKLQSLIKPDQPFSSVVHCFCEARL